MVRRRSLENYDPDNKRYNDEVLEREGFNLFCDVVGLSYDVSVASLLVSASSSLWRVVIVRVVLFFGPVGINISTNNYTFLGQKVCVFDIWIKPKEIYDL